MNKSIDLLINFLSLVYLYFGMQTPGIPFHGIPDRQPGEQMPVDAAVEAAGNYRGWEDFCRCWELPCKLFVLNRALVSPSSWTFWILQLFIKPFLCCVLLVTFPRRIYRLLPSIKPFPPRLLLLKHQVFSLLQQLSTRRSPGFEKDPLSL